MRGWVIKACFAHEIWPNRVWKVRTYHTIRENKSCVKLVWCSNKLIKWRTWLCTLKHDYRNIFFLRSETYILDRPGIYQSTTENTSSLPQLLPVGRWCVTIGAERVRKGTDVWRLTASVENRTSSVLISGSCFFFEQRKTLVGRRHLGVGLLDPTIVDGCLCVCCTALLMNLVPFAAIGHISHGRKVTTRLSSGWIISSCWIADMPTRGNHMYIGNMHGRQYNDGLSGIYHNFDVLGVLPNNWSHNRQSEYIHTLVQMKS
jgi:hypothetical protein